MTIEQKGNTMIRYYITNAERMLNWSNTDGWVATGYDQFTQQERNTLSLPIGGFWVAVDDDTKPALHTNHRKD